jgi:hypothetical protein
MVASIDLGGSTMHWYPAGEQAKTITTDRLLNQRLVRQWRRGPALMISLTYQLGSRRSDLRTVVLTGKPGANAATGTLTAELAEGT